MLICPGCRTEYDEPLEVCPKDNLPLIVRSVPSAGEPDGDPGAAETALSSGLMVGEYRIEAPIVDGEMGTTYAAIHPLIRKRVAIRVLHGRYAQDHRAVTRFVMEARAVNEIGHHNIVDILSIGELWDGRNYLVMELIDGETLREILRRAKRIGAGAALSLYEQLCDALEAVHAAGFIHRDLRPETLVVLRRPPHPFVKIQDFGLAMLKDEGNCEDDVATLVGTPVYMAPELSRGSDVDARADLYSLGVILYELLTGQAPFSAQTLFHAFSSNREPSPPAPSELAPIAPDLEQVVLRSLAWDPDQRHGSAAELARDLRHAITDPPAWDLHPQAPRRSASTPSLTLPPASREITVPPPEAIDGDMEDDDLEQTDGKAVVQIIPSETILGHMAPRQVEPGGIGAEPEDEEPTDVHTGQSLAPPGSARTGGALREKIERLKPDAFLGDAAAGELLGDDTQQSNPFETPPATGNDTVEMPVMSDVQPEPPSAAHAAGTAGASDTPGRVGAALAAPDIDEATVPEEDRVDPYCSIEILGEAGEEDRK